MDAPALAHAYDYVILIDFEATSDQDDDSRTRLAQCDVHEIIEWPAVWLAARDLDGGTTMGTEIGHFREYVQPVENPTGGGTRKLSDFCQSLTGITQANVDAACPLAEVIEHFEAWLQERNLVTALEDGRAVLVAHGGWDLGDQLPREAARKGIVLPSLFDAHADLKVVFALTCPDNKGTSLKQMLDYLQIPAQGRQHSGLDDCRNFGRILAKLLSLGADLAPTYKAGIGQLRGHGVGKRPGDWDCPQCGAVAFGSKANCYRCGEPRPAGLTPPEPAPAPAAQPSSKEKPRRPGDWDCPSCGAVVFASKPRCFKCMHPKPAHLEQSAAQRPGPTRRPGDWDCPNPSCRALVFASKTACFRCGSAPAAPMIYSMVGSIAQPAMLLPQGSMVQLASGQMASYSGQVMMQMPTGAVPAGSYVYATAGQAMGQQMGGQQMGAQQMQAMGQHAAGQHAAAAHAQQQGLAAAQYASMQQYSAALASGQHAQSAEQYAQYSAAQYYAHDGTPYAAEYDVSQYDQPQSNGGMGQMGGMTYANGQQYAAFAQSGGQSPQAQTAVNGQ